MQGNKINAFTHDQLKIIVARVDQIITHIMLPMKLRYTQIAQESKHYFPRFGHKQHEK